MGTGPTTSKINGCPIGQHVTKILSWGISRASLLKRNESVGRKC